MEHLTFILTTIQNIQQHTVKTIFHLFYENMTDTSHINTSSIINANKKMKTEGKKKKRTHHSCYQWFNSRSLEWLLCKDDLCCSKQSMMHFRCKAIK